MNSNSASRDALLVAMCAVSLLGLGLFFCTSASALAQEEEGVRGRGGECERAFQLLNEGKFAAASFSKIGRAAANPSEGSNLRHGFSDTGDV